jgi:hypothetical protein
MRSHTFINIFGFSSNAIVFPSKPFTKMYLGPCDKELHISLHVNRHGVRHSNMQNQAGCLLNVLQKP